MSQFTVGDVCIGQNFVFDTQSNGVECVITGPLEMCMVDHPIMGIRIDYFYEVQFVHETHPTCIKPFNLRKKPPKQSTDEWATEQVAKVTKPVAQPVTEEVA